MKALFEITGPGGILMALLGAAGALAALVALGLAASPRTSRPALLLAAAVAVLGTGILGWGHYTETVVGAEARASVITHEGPSFKLDHLVAAEREARASGALGILAGLPLLLASAAVSSLALRRREAQP